MTSAAAISWAAPAAIVYGTALSAAQLDATSSVPLTLTYNPPAGSVLNAGTQTLNVSGVSTTNAVPVTSAVALLVQTASTSVLVSAPSTPSNPYTVTVTVTSGNGGSVTGPVNFFDGGALIGSSQVDAKGTATFAISPLASGPHSFTSTYPGNSNNLQSTSAAVSGTVAFTCTGLRTGASCGFTPSTLVFNNSLLAQTTTVSVSLPAVRASVERRGSLRVWLAMLPGFGGLLLFGRRRGRGALAVCGVLAWRW